MDPPQLSELATPMTPFMVTNDISLRPSSQEITIKGTDITHYNTTYTDPKRNHIGRIQAYVLRAPSTSSVIWLGEYLEILDAVAARVRIVNDTTVLNLRPFPVTSIFAKCD